MRHALVIAFHYPPEASSSGVLRTLKFTRYLREHGWRCTVLTLHESAYEALDHSLAAQIPEDVRVVRTHYLNAKQHLSVRGVYPSLLAIPDRWIGWMPWAVRAGRRVIDEDPPDVVFSTSPHATAHLVAARLSRAKIPWVADFRDPWHETPPEPGTPFLVHRLAGPLERRVITRCQHVTASTPQLRDTLAQRYAGLPPQKFSAILNGYDDADFDTAATPGAGRSDDFLRIVHAGGINPDFRDPQPLLIAIKRLVDAGRIDAGRVEIVFLGPGRYGESEAFQNAVAASGLAESVRLRGRLPYADALREMAAADVLLLLQASPDTVDLIPAKLFEYLRAQRPVLALTQPGATSAVLGELDAGWAVDPGRPAALESTIADIYGVWRDGRLAAHTASSSALEKYSRRYQTGQLAEIFERLTTRHAKIERAGAV